jgi:hypothetical protein
MTTQSTCKGKAVEVSKAKKFQVIVDDETKGMKKDKIHIKLLRAWRALDQIVYDKLGVFDNHKERLAASEAQEAILRCIEISRNITPRAKQ